MSTTTAEQRRRMAKSEYDAYLSTCPSRQLLATLSDKWIVLALTALETQPLRYSELRRKIAGVSQKMLTQTLRALERDGLVERSVKISVPISVTYSMTPLGHSLLRVVAQLKSWAEDNIEEVRAAQNTFDARPPQGKL
ncbi:winged helix-turn-helix transcriptional regulator [Cryobacterium fucosi]|uniref:Transcriptional regulator n=1 Tax=Cryobacterium fucosi TaxID=1259157 RepID=A0A4R9B7B4_9MICO|nr:helix-turn-helix domain-containing protein [Cryobacterium fucosi]TFD76977.1 transcriptional regulator [Cryobacterium fucosi]